MSCDKWTKERVIAAIQLGQKQDPPLRSAWKTDRHLYFVAYRLFGSWYEAARAAGIETCMQRWSKRRVLDAIQARLQQGLPLRGIAKADRRLYTASLLHFGGWCQALIAAGLPAKPRHKWTSEAVIAAIQARHREGLPLVQVQKEWGSLDTAARAHFGTWRKAVAAAGIPDGWQHKWNKQRVIESLQECARRGHLRCNSQIPRTVRSTALGLFGTWHNALVAAGLASPNSPHVVQKRRTNADLLAEIRRGSAPDRPMRSTRNLALTLAARKRFGSWGAALLAAGIDPVRWKIWSPQRVLDEIRACYRRGVPIRRDCPEHRKLIAAARGRFGSWRNALVQAGVIDPGERDARALKWTRQRIIETIQDLHIHGLSLSASDNRWLRYAIGRYFGTWNAARAAAGILMDCHRKPRTKWMPEKVLERIRQRRERGLDVVNVRRSESGLEAAGRRHFGSWRGALAAAGIVLGRKRR